MRDKPTGVVIRGMKSEKRSPFTAMSLRAHDKVVDDSKKLGKDSLSSVASKGGGRALASIGVCAVRCTGRVPFRNRPAGLLLQMGEAESIPTFLFPGSFSRSSKMVCGRRRLPSTEHGLFSSA